MSGGLAARRLPADHAADDGRPALQGRRVRACCGPAPTRPAGIDLWLCTLVGIGVTAGLFVITDYYTSTRFRPVRTTARASQTGHATNIIQGLAQGFQSTAAPAILLALGILRRQRARRHLRHRRGGDGAAVAHRPDRRARRVRPDHRQRRRHRRDGGPARGGARRDRPARRGRQHHQGRDEGLRDRLGRARGAGAVRRVRRGAARGGGQERHRRRVASTSRSPRC